MNKCLTMVHLTSTFRIRSRVPGDSKAGKSSVSCAMVTALLGWWQPIDSAPAATEATGAAVQH